MEENEKDILETTEEYKIEAATTEKVNLETQIVEEQRKKSKKKLLIGLSFAVILFSIIIYIFILSPMLKYNKAESYLKEKKYLEASKIYQELGDYKDSKQKYKDSKEKHTESKYQEAINLYDRGMYADAKEIFLYIAPYQGTTEYLAAIDLHEGKDVDPVYLGYISNLLGAAETAALVLPDFETGKKYLKAKWMCVSKPGWYIEFTDTGYTTNIPGVTGDFWISNGIHYSKGGKALWRYEIKREGEMHLYFSGGNSTIPFIFAKETDPIYQFYISNR